MHQKTDYQKGLEKQKIDVLLETDIMLDRMNKEDEWLEERGWPFVSEKEIVELFRKQADDLFSKGKITYDHFLELQAKNELFLVNCDCLEGGLS